MAQYIDKDALLTEIERRMKLRRDGYEKYKSVSDFIAWEELEYFKEEFLPTLEVKDVDLEKESELIANEIMIGVQANKYHTNIYNTNRNDFNHSHLCLAARKGIELGLKAQKGE